MTKAIRAPSRNVLALAAFSLFFGTIAAARAGDTLPTDPKPTCVAANFPTWFQSGAPSLNGVVDPADSVNFSETVNGNVINCQFYLWSEQMFLWLTSPTPLDYGGGGGRIWDSSAFYEVTAPALDGSRILVPHRRNIFHFFQVALPQNGPHRLPIVSDRSGRWMEVVTAPPAADGNSLVRDEKGALAEVVRIKSTKDARPIFIGRDGKPIHAVVTLNADLLPDSLFGPQPRAQIGSGARLQARKQHLLLALLAHLSKVPVVEKFVVVGKTVFVNLANGQIAPIEQGQAISNAVLLTQSGALVYYDICVNDVLAYYLTQVKDANGGGVPPATQFPTTQAQLTSIVNFAGLHGKTFVDPNALAIEVKTSWVEASTLPNNGQDYITETTRVPVYDTSNPALWTMTGSKTAVLAMLGMHVVGSAAGHPEMIWATYEHVDNSPHGAFRYIDSNNVTQVVPQNMGDASVTWQLSATGFSPPYNVQRAVYNPAPANTIAGIPLVVPSNTKRTMPFGAALDAAPNPLAIPKVSNTDIISINDDILNKMAAAGAAGDVRNKYVFVGSTWTIGGHAPTGSFSVNSATGNEVGTSLLANSTMETYEQGASVLIKDNNGNVVTGATNCFTCHGTNTTQVSHIFSDLAPLFP